MIRIAVIGAGMAGLACARRLQDAGSRVRVFEKARGVGGRMATRRVETAIGIAQFDHGAQYFTARDSAFQTALQSVASSMGSWPDDVSTRIRGQLTPVRPEPRFVGAPGMSAIAKAMADGLDVHLSVRIEAMTRDEAGWTLQAESGASFGPFDAVVVATPAEQVGALVSPHSAALSAEAAQARTVPCWAGLFAYAGSTSSSFSALRLTDHEVLSWVARDSSKPRRPGDLECWVAHARADWSAEHLERAPEDIVLVLREALESILEASTGPIYQQAHRWRYAQVDRPAKTPFAWDPDLQLGLCGDWRMGPRVEAAWSSGHLLAEAILA